MISLFQHGGPSHVDLFDPKPELTRLSGSDYPGEVQFSFVNRASKTLFGSPWKFAKHGQCGTEVSELLPHLAGIVDDVCLIRSMHTGANGHEVSIRYFHGGIPGVVGRPTLGLVARLRTRLREPGAAGVSGADRSGRTSGRRRQQLVERLHAAVVSGHGVAAARAANSESRSAALPARHSAGSEPGLPAVNSIGDIWKSIRAKPIWKRGSPATNWPPPCRRPPPKHSTFQARRPRRISSTASTTRKRKNTARAA